MKKLTFAVLLTSGVLIGQNRQIQFEHGNLASVLEKAKKENKLIFVDAYTTWCGPCKWLAKNVFTNDTVADYFNANFVNYKLDMEKGEGIEFAKKYEVSCYPNLLFINADGEIAQRGAGGMPVSMLMDFAKATKDPSTTFVGIKDRMLKEGLNEMNINNYANLLRGSCLDPAPEIQKYLSKVKDEDLMKRSNWMLMRDYVYNPDSREIKYMMNNYSAFESSFGKDTVEGKVVQLGRMHFNKFVQSPGFNKEGYEAAKKEFETRKWPRTGQIIFEADLNVYERFDTKKYYELAAADFLTYNSNNSGALNSMAWEFYEKVDDKKLLNAAVKMAERACALRADYAYLDTYAAVLYKSGNFREAEKHALLAIEKAKSEKMGEDEYKDTAELLKKIKANLK